MTSVVVRNSRIEKVWGLTFAMLKHCVRSLDALYLPDLWFHFIVSLGT